MYEQFYGLQEKPFLLTPDADLFYLSRHHKAALNMLEYGLHGHASFIAITGEVGTGKTTLIRRFLQEVDESSTVGVITNTHRSFGDLLQWILLAFGLDYKNKDKVELYDVFVDFLINEYAANRRTMLIIDEAQNMDVETLEELRMLSNVNLRKDLVLQTVLVGQPELLDILKRPDMRQLAQRISVEYHLVPLTCQETVEYIRHRVSTVGGRPDLFDPTACVVIHHLTQGIPRLINVLCDTALVYGFAEDQEQIDFETICAVVQDKQRGGLAALKMNLTDVSLGDLSKDLARLAKSCDLDEGEAIDGEEERGNNPPSVFSERASET